MPAWRSGVKRCVLARYKKQVRFIKFNHVVLYILCMPYTELDILIYKKAKNKTKNVRFKKKTQHFSTQL